MAKKYRGNFELLDVINEGNLGLIKAIDRFDINLGFRFSTYAAWWIRQSIQKFLLYQNLAIRIPENLYSNIIRFKKRVAKLEQIEKRSLTIEEISKILNVPISTVKEYLQYNYDLISLDQTIGEDNDSTIGDLYMFDNTFETKIMQESLKEEIKILFKTLTPREIEIIKLRYGLREDNKIFSLQEIGKIYNLSRERIRQIESKALNKMKVLTRNNEKCNALKSYIK